MDEPGITWGNFFVYWFYGLAALFPMVNPFSTIPLLLTLTERMTAEETKRQATRAARNATIIMLVALLLGNAILEFFSISISALQIAGGLIVAYLGFRMLFPVPTASVSEQTREQQDFSLIPLALPSMSGAGTLATVMTFSSEIQELPTWGQKGLGVLLAACVIVTVGLLAAFILRAATPISNRLGHAGLDALARIMGLLLVCIGVQFIANGVDGFNHTFREADAGTPAYVEPVQVEPATPAAAQSN